MRLAATHADIWSGFATESSLPEWFVPMLKQLDEACAKVDRDIGSLGRSIGVVIEPGTTMSAEATGFGVPISGSADEMADALNRFEQIGVDRLEIIPFPGNEETLAAIEPTIRLLNS